MFADVSLPALAVLADELTAAPTEADFEALLLGALHDMRRRTGAVAVVLRVRWGPGPENTRTFDVTRTPRHRAVASAVQAWVAPASARREGTPIDTAHRLAAVVAVEPRSLGGPGRALVAAGVHRLWIVPGARSMRARSYAFLAFDRDVPDPSSTDASALGIYATLLMSRAIARLGAEAWQRARAVVEDLPPPAYAFLVDEDGELRHWPFPTLHGTRTLIEQLHPADRAAVADALGALFQGQLTTAVLEVRRIVPGDDERVRLVARVAESGDVEGIVFVLPSTHRSLPATLARHLTSREQEIALAIADGARVRNVAGDLYLSQHTVRNHLRSIFAKLGVSSQTELIDLVKRSPR